MDRHEDAFGGIDNTRAHEHDYDGTNTLRGFRWGLALAGLLWIGIGAAACAELDVKSAEGARVVAKTARRVAAAVHAPVTLEGPTETADKRQWKS